MTGHEVTMGRQQVDEEWDWLPVSEAARRTGLTESALSKRRQRDQWPAQKDTSGQWLYQVPRLDSDATEEDERPDNRDTVQMLREVIDAQREEIRWLRARVEALEEAGRRGDIITMNLTERLPRPELTPIELPATTGQQVDKGAPNEPRPWWKLW